MQFMMIKRCLTLPLLLLVALCAGNIHAVQSAISVTAVQPVEVKAMILPDLSVYTLDNIELKLHEQQQLKTSREIVLERIFQHDELIRYTQMGKLALFVEKQQQLPEAIIIKKGIATVESLYKTIDDETVIAQPEPGIYLLKRPLLIKTGATLLVDSSVKALYLSEEKGSFLVNSGMLFILKSKVIAWRESTSSPALFRKDKEFRPFILSLSNSETYLAESEFRSLGFLQGKSYGFSMSDGPKKLLANNQNTARPTGWIINNLFSDMYYGYYSYEADDVVILNNQYADNIVYAIDPHDRSKRLIIARNHTYGTKRKHGIIVSREVQDSYIIFNKSYANKGSGIVVDRTSRNNYIYKNVSMNNQADGITLYESSNSFVDSNEIINNSRDGIRIRNSQDIYIVNNRIDRSGMYAVNAYVREKFKVRDESKDPFLAVTTILLIFNNKFSDNKSGVFGFSDVSDALIGKNFFGPEQKIFSDYFNGKGSKIFSVIFKDKQTAYIKKNNSKVSL